MKLFIAGVMQGNRNDNNIYSQDYRKTITKKVSDLFENVQVVDPDLTDPDRLMYTHEQAKNMFMKYCKVAGEVDLLVSFIPEASMGSAIEMWMAHQNNIPIVTISPMKSNWVVKLLSDVIYEDIQEFLTNFNQETFKALVLR
ncbi:MAG: hypothetical protein KBD43_16455 [Saprospiraceae bacterium]|nr:hypothetical protein [Saprospiraceae bacterium]